MRVPGFTEFAVMTLVDVRWDRWCQRGDHEVIACDGERHIELLQVGVPKVALRVVRTQRGRAPRDGCGELVGGNEKDEPHDEQSSSHNLGVARLDNDER